MSFSAPSDSRQILTPTKLNRLARTILQSEIGLVWLTAEISNFVAASSGHWYFTLKDNKAQVRAAMFKQANRYLKFRPKEGDKVLVRASVGLYEPRGDYQLIIEHLEAEGEGRLKLAFEQLKIKLNNEGLFSTERKRPLPNRITRVGVITSPSGAAIHDVLTVLARRCPDFEVVIYPSLVQGEQATQALRQALCIANQRNEVDVLLLTRGGGAIEDLWCFNDEQLARDIVNSNIAVVSAVGHEVDVTIADYVADVRAPTPSAAAELISPDRAARLTALSAAYKRLTAGMHLSLMQAKQKLVSHKRQLPLLHPTRQLTQLAQRLDMLSIQNHQAMLNRLSQAKQKLNVCKIQLEKTELRSRIDENNLKLQHIQHKLNRSLKLVVNNKQKQLSQLVGQLQLVSPLATLARGYSITTQDAKVVSSVNDIKLSQPIVTKLADGEVISNPVKKLEG